MSTCTTHNSNTPTYIMASASKTPLTHPSPSTYTDAATSYAEKQKLIAENTAPTPLHATKAMRLNAENNGERKTPEPTPYEQKLIDVVSSSIDSLSTMRSRGHKQITQGGDGGCRDVVANKSFTDICHADLESEEYHALIEMSILQSASLPVHSVGMVTGSHGGGPHYPTITCPPPDMSLRRDVRVCAGVTAGTRSPAGSDGSVRSARTLSDDSVLMLDGRGSPLDELDEFDEDDEFEDEEFDESIGSDAHVVIEDARCIESLRGVINTLSTRPEYDHIDFRLQDFLPEHLEEGEGEGEGRKRSSGDFDGSELVPICKRSRISVGLQ